MLIRTLLAVLVVPAFAFGQIVPRSAECHTQAGVDLDIAIRQPGETVPAAYIILSNFYTVALNHKGTDTLKFPITSRSAGEVRVIAGQKPDKHLYMTQSKYLNSSKCEVLVNRLPREKGPEDGNLISLTMKCDNLLASTYDAKTDEMRLEKNVAPLTNITISEPVQCSIVRPAH